MDASRHIVVGVDGSAGSVCALRWALEQAQLSGATVQAINAWEYPNMYGSYPLASDIDWRSNAQQILDVALNAVVGLDTAKVSTTVVEGHPATVLLEASVGAELLVVGNRGHGGFVEALLGSVSQHVITHATCPVVVIRSDTQAEPAPPPAHPGKA